MTEQSSNLPGELFTNENVKDRLKEGWRPFLTMPNPESANHVLHCLAAVYGVEHVAGYQPEISTGRTSPAVGIFVLRSTFDEQVA